MKRMRTMNFIYLEINLSGYVRNFFKYDGLEYCTQWKGRTINMRLAKSFVPELTPHHVQNTCSLKKKKFEVQN